MKTQMERSARRASYRRLLPLVATLALLLGVSLPGALAAPALWRSGAGASAISSKDWPRSPAGSFGESAEHNAGGRAAKLQVPADYTDPTTGKAHACAGRRLLYRTHVDAAYVTKKDGKLTTMVIDGNAVAPADSVCVWLTSDGLPATVNPKNLVGTDAGQLLIDRKEQEFLGKRGQILWHAPQTFYDGHQPVWAGLGAFEPGHEKRVPENLAKNNVQVKLTAFNGPGYMEVFSVNPDKSANRMLSTRQGILSYNLFGKSHGHFSWVFSHPGVYHLTFQPIVEWTQADGAAKKEVAAPQTVTWLVGTPQSVGLPPDAAAWALPITTTPEKLRDQAGLSPVDPDTVYPPHSGDFSRLLDANGDPLAGGGADSGGGLAPGQGRLGPDGWIDPASTKDPRVIGGFDTAGVCHVPAHSPLAAPRQNREELTENLTDLDEYDAWLEEHGQEKPLPGQPDSGTDDKAGSKPDHKPNGKPGGTAAEDDTDAEDIPDDETEDESGDDTDDESDDEDADDGDTEEENEPSESDESASPDSPKDNLKDKIWGNIWDKWNEPAPPLGAKSAPRRAARSVPAAPSAVDTHANGEHDAAAASGGYVHITGGDLVLNLQRKNADTPATTTQRDSGWELRQGEEKTDLRGKRVWVEVPDGALRRLPFAQNTSIEGPANGWVWALGTGQDAGLRLGTDTTEANLEGLAANPDWVLEVSGMQRIPYRFKIGAFTGDKWGPSMDSTVISNSSGFAVQPQTTEFYDAVFFHPGVYFDYDWKLHHRLVGAGDTPSSWQINFVVGNEAINVIRELHGITERLPLRETWQCTGPVPTEDPGTVAPDPGTTPGGSGEQDNPAGEGGQADDKQENGKQDSGKQDSGKQDNAPVIPPPPPGKQPLPRPHVPGNNQPGNNQQGFGGNKMLPNPLLPQNFPGGMRPGWNAPPPRDFGGGNLGLGPNVQGPNVLGPRGSGPNTGPNGGSNLGANANNWAGPLGNLLSEVAKAWERLFAPAQPPALPVLGQAAQPAAPGFGGGVSSGGVPSTGANAGPTLSSLAALPSKNSPTASTARVNAAGGTTSQTAAGKTLGKKAKGKLLGGTGSTAKGGKQALNALPSAGAEQGTGTGGFAADAAAPGNAATASASTSQLAIVGAGGAAAATGVISLGVAVYRTRWGVSALRALGGAAPNGPTNPN